MAMNQLDLFGGESAIKTKDMSYTNIPHYSVELVREKTSPLAKLAPVTSPDDITVTKRIVEAGDILNVQVFDHIIIGDDCYISLKEKGYM